MDTSNLVNPKWRLSGFVSAKNPSANRKSYTRVRIRLPIAILVSSLGVQMNLFINTLLGIVQSA